MTNRDLLAYLTFWILAFVVWIALLSNGIYGVLEDILTVLEATP